MIAVLNKAEKEQLMEVFRKHGITKLPDGRAVRRAIKGQQPE